MTDLKESGVDSVFVRQVEEGYVLSGGGPTVSESFLCRGEQPVVVPYAKDLSTPTRRWVSPF